MFDIIPNLVTLFATSLFPIFAAYKALKAPTPPSLAPWLTFYTVLALLHLLESTILYPLSYLPLYAWLRCGFHLYLLMPAPQGATHIYNTYVYPFLLEHETEIEEIISQTHERARAAGLQYIKQAVEWIRVNVLGQEPHPPTPPASSYQSYAQTLLSRFYSTSSTGNAGSSSAAGDVYSLVFSAIQSATATRSGAVNRSAAVGDLIPPNLSPDDRLKYIREARQGLGAVLQAFEREEVDVAASRSDDTLSKSRSETDFDKIEREEVSPDRGGKSHAHRTPSGSWIPWGWTGKTPDVTGAAKKDEGPSSDDVPPQAHSTGMNLND